MSVALGYRSNVLSNWERGVAWPSASRALAAAQLAGRDIDALGRLAGADWLDRVELASRDGVALILDRMLGHMPVRELSKRTGISPHALSRYLNAKSEASLPDFLLLIEVSGLLKETLSIIADPLQLPVVAAAWRSHLKATLTYANSPMAGDVHRAMHLKAYQALPVHRSGWFSRLLDLTLDEEKEAIRSLLQAGLIVMTAEGRYECVEPDVVSQSRSAREPHQRAWMQRQLHVGESVLLSQTTALASSSEIRRIERIFRKASDQVRTILGDTTATDSMVRITLSITALPDNTCTPRRS